MCGHSRYSGHAYDLGVLIGDWDYRRVVEDVESPLKV